MLCIIDRVYLTRSVCVPAITIGTGEPHVSFETNTTAVLHVAIARLPIFDFNFLFMTPDVVSWVGVTFLINAIFEIVVVTISWLLRLRWFNWFFFLAISESAIAN